MQDTFVETPALGLGAEGAKAPRGRLRYSAGTLASQLLKNVEIANRIAELTARVVKRVIKKAAITAADVVAELAKIGFADITAVILRPSASL